MNRTAVNNRSNALANNYIYINENKISSSLICPICLDPMIDPQTHVLCENSFCNRCIKKLKHCPCCRAMINESNDLKMTNHVIRNILNELHVQCNICKKTVGRGDFVNHIQNSCLQLSSSRASTDDSNSNKDNKYVERHFSNLYRRLNTVENDLYELKTVIWIFLFVLSMIGIILVLNRIFLYFLHSFISVDFTARLRIFIRRISKFFSDLSIQTAIKTT